MRLATFNVENLFDRPRAMNLDTWPEGKPALEDFKHLNELIQSQTYTSAAKSKMLEIMRRHKGLLTTGDSTFLCLRNNRGTFLRKPKNKPVEIAASGRAAWSGWFELVSSPVKETATQNTARILGLVNAEVQCIIEAEDRPTLRRFNNDVLPSVEVSPFSHVMLIDGNDERGIDVGILSRREYEIVRIVSHVDDQDDVGLIFSRDCAEYEIRTAQGNKLLVLLNHFKSKGYGKPSESAAKRLRQAQRVRDIYEQRIAEGYQYIAVVGDLNEVPDAPPMAPLVADGVLTDIMVHAKFTGDDRPGTHGNGTKSAKLDYIILSPRLSDKVTAGGIERRGVWGGENGTLFPHLDTMQAPVDAASDHAALWADLSI
jgi:endonuclease/exonuclease/phosphatase family metal-dependent hydrolase